MKKIIFMLFIFISSKSFARLDSLNQYNFDKHLTIELGGSGGLYSINYETPWQRTAQMQFRAGGTVFKFDNRWQITLFNAIQKTLGMKKNKFIFGGGIAFTFAWYYNRKITEASAWGFATRGILIAGWHYQKPNSRIFYRICYTPIFSFTHDWQYDNWAGFTIGYTLIP